MRTYKILFSSVTLAVLISGFNNCAGKGSPSVFVEDGTSLSSVSPTPSPGPNPAPAPTPGPSPMPVPGGDPNLNRIVYSASGVFTVPQNVTQVRVVVVGGGGSGGASKGNILGYTGGGGGAAGQVRAAIITVQPGNGILVTVGAGGLGSANADGKPSSFGNNLVAEGGGAGFDGNANGQSAADGGDGGGSGGGAGGGTDFVVFSDASGAGGMLGGNGQDSNEGDGGKGKAWDSLVNMITKLPYSAGSGGGAAAALIPNGSGGGGGGGGGLVIGNVAIKAGGGNQGGVGYGAGGGGGGDPGLGTQVNGFNGAAGAVYVEW